MKNVLGKKHKIFERKSSKFGTPGVIDRGSELSFSSTIVNRSGKQVTQKYYNNIKRNAIYVTALDKFIHDELAKPIVNLISGAVFSGDPDFQGSKDLVKRSDKIIKDSKIDWSTWGADLEVFGDVFVESFPDGKNPKIASIPAQTIDIVYNEDNIIEIESYVQNANKDGERLISPALMEHLKINNTSNMVFGSSTLRPVFWWLDVLDNLWERTWIRGSEYYGAPIVAVIGVPPDHIESVRKTLESKGQRPGRNWVFPEGITIEVPDFTKNYPMEMLVDRVYQYILSACGIPQHLVYESDSSRGVAMFSGDAFEMIIRMGQKTWEIGIIAALRNIFKAQGISNADTGELKIEWGPIFTRDLKNLASLLKVGMEHKLYSRKSAREVLKLDHSIEVANLKQQKKDEPDEIPQAPAVPGNVAPKPKTTQSQ